MDYKDFVEIVQKEDVEEDQKQQEKVIKKDMIHMKKGMENIQNVVVYVKKKKVLEKILD